MSSINIISTKKNFLKEITRLKQLDDLNQSYFLGFSKKRISKKQIEYLSEFIFFSGFRDYENFIGSLFSLYSCGHVHSSKKSVKSYLNPKNTVHALELMKSSMPFLEWSSPNLVIDRSELCFKDGFPFKLSLTTHYKDLLTYKRIRNHIAHNSPESLKKYKNVVKDYYSTLPLKLPSPGKYLLLPDKNNSSTYILRNFFDLMETLCNELT